MSCSTALNNPRPTTPDVSIILVAAAALINDKGEVLISQRPQDKKMGGLWEFPGGKIEPGETPEFALMRELEEELGIETRPCCFHPVAFASHSYEDFHLLMPLFTCRTWKGEVQLKEHQAHAWSRPTDILSYPILEADIPLVTALCDLL